MGKGVKKKKKAGPGRPPVPRSKRDKAQHRRDGCATKQAASKNRASEILIKQGFARGRYSTSLLNSIKRADLDSHDSESTVISGDKRAIAGTAEEVRVPARA